MADREHDAGPVVEEVLQSAQGIEIDLTLDHARFEETSAVLFCAVLRQFFALYAAVNTVVQVRLCMPNIKGVLKEWPPLAGNQLLL